MDLKSILCIDLECTCWEGERSNALMEKREIIEIGVSILHIGSEGSTIEKGKQIYVKNVRSDISKYCTDLTGITQAIIDEKGIPFSDACKLLCESYGSKNRPWISWGRFDRDQMLRECRKTGVEYPMSSEYFNLSILFSLMNRRKRKTGMRKAMNYLDIDFQGTPHCGADDAYNLAKIALELFW